MRTTKAPTNCALPDRQHALTAPTTSTWWATNCRHRDAAGPVPVSSHDLIAPLYEVRTILDPCAEPGT